jgi:short-subunit dehydrogenase
MRRDLRGKRILISGASSGIGHAVAEAAAHAGMRVFITGRSETALKELAGTLAERGHDVASETADITLLADRERLFHAVVDRFGGLDILLNNAGIGAQGAFTDSSTDVLRQVMEVNFFAHAEMVRHALPILKKGQQPAIVQVASMCGRRSMPFWSEYSASKFAICGLLEALRAELVRYGISVLLILPGVTSTNLGRNLLQTDGKIAFKFENGMKPEYVANQILHAIEKDRAETVLGFEARWFIRVNRWFPWVVNTGLARYVRRRYAAEEE